MNKTKVDNHPFKLKKYSSKNLLRIVFNLFLQSQKTGMSPEAHADKRLNDESVAQLVEQYTFNVWVLGPSPSGFTLNRRNAL